MVRTYRVPKLITYAAVAFSLVWGGGWIASTIADSPSPPQSRVDFGIWLGLILVGFLPVFYLFVVYEVRLTDDGTCEFRSAVRVRRVRAQQISSISTDDDAIYVRFPGGKVHMWETRDFDELLNLLVELNPAIELRGWVRERAH